jgi:hypothetical protein
MTPYQGKKQFQVVRFNTLTHAASLDFDWSIKPFDTLEDAKKRIVQEKINWANFAFAIIEFDEFSNPPNNGKFVYFEYPDYCLEKKKIKIVKK